MQIFVSTPLEYIATLPSDRQEVIEKLRASIKKNLPEWFVECMNYGMIGYVVPHSIYPAGYHCDTSLPLPFMALASQKNSINLYHMGIYANPELLKWWQDEYAKLNIGKLDMGKSCIRFGTPMIRGDKGGSIPYNLIGELCQKITVDEWINLYEQSLKKK
jgi:hypothetical protein